MEALKLTYGGSRTVPTLQFLEAALVKLRGHLRWWVLESLVAINLITLREMQSNRGT